MAFAALNKKDRQTVSLRHQISCLRPVFSKPATFYGPGANQGRHMARILETRLWLALPGLLFTLSVSSPAAADGRDQVISNATRCAVIGEDRQWLDCYYGAAQPVRAELGLRPVTEAQVKLFTNPPVGNPAAGSPIVRSSVLRSAFGCSPAQDERSWLNCFYAAAEPMRARLGLASAVQAAPPPAPRLQTPENFGLPAKPLPGEASRVRAHMASYSFDDRHLFTVILENGQVWRQLEGDTTFARWAAAPNRYLVTISKGMLGSFNLTVTGEPGLFKVRRLK
jgi:hypothetical protein